MDIYAFWKAILDQNAQEIRKYFHPDARVTWHCTNERFTLEEFLIANCEYPGDWEGTVERVERLRDLIITVTNVRARDQSLSCHVTSFIKIRGDRIASMEEYWADDGPAPRWRLEKHIGTPVH